MRILQIEILSALHRLFPTKARRLGLVGLVLISAFISVSELLVAHLFSRIVLDQDRYSATEFIVFASLFLGFFAATKMGHSIQKIYRVTYFDKTFKESDRAVSAYKQNWDWSLAFELSGVLGILTQLIVITTFFTYINPLFSLINFILILLTIQFFGIIFKKQLKHQRGFVDARIRKENIANSVKVATRIRSGEFGAIGAGLGTVIALGILIILSYNNEISAGNTIVLFFGLKMQTTNLTALSIGLMRFARATSNTE